MYRLSLLGILEGVFMACIYFTHEKSEALPNNVSRGSGITTRQLFSVSLLCFLSLAASVNTWNYLYCLLPLLKLFREGLCFNYHNSLASRADMAVNNYMFHE